MRLFGDLLYFEFDELVSAGIPIQTIKNGLHRKSSFWAAFEDPQDRRRVLIAYEPLMAKHKQKIIAHYGNPYAAARKQQSLQELQVLHQNRNRLLSVLRPNQAHYELFIANLSHTEAIERTLACAWLHFLNEVKGPVQAKAYGFDSKEELIDAALEQITQAKMKCLRVTNKRVLRDWMKRYKEQGASCMKNPWMGNQSARKIEEEQLRYLMTLMSDTHKPNVVMITVLFNQEAATRGWKQVTSVTVYNWMKKPELAGIWTMGRHGEDAWYQQFDVTILRKGPSAPDVLWVGDGTPVDLYYKKVRRKWDEKAQKWVERVNYFNRLDVFLIIDAYSWRILGWNLVENENAESVIRALKMAAGENMRLPRQFQHDGGSGIEAQKWLIDQLDIHNTKTRPYSPKAKVIEAIIGKIQDQVLRFFDNWAGMNITAKKADSRFNPDALEKDNIPDYDGLVQQWKDVVTIWNNKATKDREAPHLKYFAAESAGTSVEPLSFINMFWEKRRDTYLYRQEGITIQIDGNKHHFQVLDADFYKKYIRDRFEVVYDRDCLDYVYLYQNGKPVLDKHGEPILATAAELVPMALHDMEEGDRAKINARLAMKDQVKADTKAALDELNIYRAENNISLGARQVFKRELNIAETAVKTSQITGVDWGKELENMYFDED